MSESLRQRRHCLFPPTLCERHMIEYSVHECPRTIQRELPRLFPEQSPMAKEFLIVPTFQPSSCDLIKFGPEPDSEKDRLLKKFFHWGDQVVAKIKDKGFWADVTDPCTGFPLRSVQGSIIYSDVDANEILLGYRVDESCGCRILSHPKWHTAVYPATLFTTAPLTTVLPILEEVCQNGPVIQ